MKRRRGRRRKQLLDELKEKRGYWKPKGEALDRSRCRPYFERGYGLVVRQTRSYWSGRDVAVRNNVVCRR